MTQTPIDADALQAIRARSALVRTVRALLKGTGLDTRELTNELVISSPGHPDHGRIYITYANGDVSHRRTTWDYLGRFKSQPGTNHDTEPGVDADTIIATLSGQQAR
jgi:hypothetical protein